MQSHLIINPQRLRITIRLQPIQPSLDPNTRPFVPTKRDIRRQTKMRIHPSAPRLKLSRHALRALQILAPHRRAEPHLGAVRAGNDVRFIGPFEEREDRAEELVGHDARGVGWGGCRLWSG